MTYLYHAKSNEFYIFTSQLAKRNDMQVVEADSLEEAKAKVAKIHGESETLAAAATPTAAAKPKTAAAPKAAAKPKAEPASVVEAAPAPVAEPAPAAEAAPEVKKDDLFEE